MRHLFYCNCNIQLLGIDQVSQKMISNLRAALFLCIQRLENTCEILEAALHLNKKRGVIYIQTQYKGITIAL